MTLYTGKTYTALSAYDLAGGDTATDAISCAGIESGLFQISQSAVTGTTKTIACKVQCSLDGTNWSDVASATATTADAAASVVHINLTSLFYPYVRVYADAHADVTGGALTVKFWGKIATS